MPIRTLRSIVAGQPPTTASRTASVLEAALAMKAQGKGAPIFQTWVQILQGWEA